MDVTAVNVPDCQCNFGSEELSLVCGQKLSRLLAGLGKLIDVPRERTPIEETAEPPLLPGYQILGWMIDVMSNLLSSFRPMTI